MTLISVRVPIRGTGCCARAPPRASPTLPSRSLRRRCASRSPCGDGRPSSPYWCCVCPHGRPCGMSVSLCAASPQAGGWSAPLRRPLREGRRGPGRCYRQRPLRSSMRWREPVTASVLRMPTGRPCGMPVSLCAASPQAGGWLAPLRRPLREGRRGLGRCYRQRPLRSSMRWREPVTASVLLRAIAQLRCRAVWP